MSTPTSDTAAIRQTIRALLAAGYDLNYVHDGEEKVTVNNETQAIDAIDAVDDAYLFVFHADEPVDGGTHVRFVLGNDPEECPADYSTSLEHVMGPLMASWS